MKIMEVAGTLPLKSLDLSFNYLTNTLDQDFLVNIVLNIKHVEFIATFNTCQRTSLQILNKILDGVSLTSVLRSINLAGCDLDRLSISRIVKLNSLSELSMEGAFLREDQARALLIEMGKSSNIQKFDIGSESIFGCGNF